MTENMKKFLETVSGSEDLARKANAMTRGELLAFAKELGIELTEADFEAPTGKLSDDELENVAGGGECFCAVGGGGTKNGNNDTCGCVLYGMGVYKKDGKVLDWRCECLAAGNGTEGPA